MLPNVDVLELENTKFYVVNEKNWQQVFDTLKKKNYDPVIFGVTDDGYEILSVNNAKVLQLVKQQRAIIAAYEDYYENTSRAINENNKSAEEEAASAKKEQETQGSNEGILPNASILKRLLPW